MDKNSLTVKKKSLKSPIRGEKIKKAAISKVGRNITLRLSGHMSQVIILKKGITNM